MKPSSKLRKELEPFDLKSLLTSLWRACEKHGLKPGGTRIMYAARELGARFADQDARPLLKSLKEEAKAAL